MSIELIGVTTRTRRTIAPVVYQDLNIRIEDGDHTALLGPKTSGLNMLIDLICGSNAPEKGKVVRTSSISWPIPEAGFIHKHLSFVGNARFIARLYGKRNDEFVPRVIAMAGVGEFQEERMDFCPKELGAQLAFALGACLEFDFYLLTNLKSGGSEHAERFQKIIQDLGRTSGLVVATSSGKGIEDFCDKAYVLDGGKAIYYEDIEAAQEHLKQISSKGDDVADFLDVPEEELADDFF